jgi:hypothetical protein
MGSDRRVAQAKKSEETFLLQTANALLDSTTNQNNIEDYPSLRNLVKAVPACGLPLKQFLCAHPQ